MINTIENACIDELQRFPESASEPLEENDIDTAIIKFNHMIYTNK